MDKRPPDPTEQRTNALLANHAAVERIWDRDRVAELYALRVVLGLPRRLSKD